MSLENKWFITGGMVSFAFTLAWFISMWARGRLVDLKCRYFHRKYHERSSDPWIPGIVLKGQPDFWCSECQIWRRK